VCLHPTTPFPAKDGTILSQSLIIKVLSIYAPWLNAPTLFFDRRIPFLNGEGGVPNYGDYLKMQKKAITKDRLTHLSLARLTSKQMFLFLADINVEEA